MCTFILARLRSGSDVERVRSLTGWDWKPIENRSLERSLGAGFEWFRVTGGACDCGTALGSASEVGFAVRERLPRGAERWSATKRARWHAQREAVVRRRSDQRERAQTSELTGWRTAIHAVVALTGELGLLLHFFQAGFDEEIDVRVAEEARASDQRLRELRFDALHRFTAARRS